MLILPQQISLSKHLLLDNRSLHHTRRLLPQNLIIFTTKINNKYQEKGCFMFNTYNYEGYTKLINSSYTSHYLLLLANAMIIF
jgi:hypothetical protein